MKLLPAILICLSLASCAQVMASDLETVYQTIAMESANQPVAGQIAVASVIIERSKRSGKALEAVCKAPRQFSCWNSPKEAKRWLRTYYTPKVRGEAVRAVKIAFLKPSKTKFTHYHAIGCYPRWARGHKGVRIGDHLFYRGIR